MWTPQNLNLSKHSFNIWGKTNSKKKKIFFYTCSRSDSAEEDWIKRIQRFKEEKKADEKEKRSKTIPSHLKIKRQFHRLYKKPSQKASTQINYPKRRHVAKKYIVKNL